MKRKYLPPYTTEQLKQTLPKDLVNALLNDPIHKWRAETGIELIHKEPTLKEQKRIWQNWQLMTEEQKMISETKSLELFGMTNQEHHYQILTSRVNVF